MSRLSGPIKDEIITILQELKDADIIGAYLADDLSPNPLSMDFPGYPCIVLGMCSQESGYETNQQNMRTYEYPLLIVARPDSYKNDPKGFENFIDDISDAFDNKFDLNGKANGGVDATFTRPAPINSSDNTYLVTFAIIRARAVVDLTLN